MRVDKIKSMQIREKIRVNIYEIRDKKLKVYCSEGHNSYIFVNALLYVGNKIEKIKECLEEGEISPEIYKELISNLYKPGGP